MPTISAGSSASVTITSATELINIVPAAGGVASFEVVRGGRSVGGDRISSERNEGPFQVGDVVTITAQRGAVDYTLGDFVDNSLQGKEAALSSLVSGAGLRSRVMVFGDSMVAREWLDTATETTIIGYGWISHANVIGGRRWEIISNLGVIGDTTDQMLARMDAALAVVKAQRIGTVILSASTNDIFISLKSAAATIATLRQVIESFTSAGCYVIWKNETPRTFVDAGKVAIQHAVNAWALDYESRNPNAFSVFDAAAVIVNATSTQYAPTAGRLDGAVHLLNVAACLIGKAFDAKYRNLFTPQSRLITSASDAYSVSTDSGQLWTNPLMTGSGGSLGNSGGGTAPTGTVAASTQVDHAVNSAATCTCSVVSQADGFGSAQRIVIANAANNDRWTVRNTTNITTGVSPGDLLELECDVRVSSHAQLVGLPVFIQAAVDGGTINYAYDLRHDAVNAVYTADFVGGNFRTRPFRLPPGSAVTALQWRVEPRFSSTAGGAGAAQIDVSRVSLRNLTRLGLDN